MGMAGHGGPPMKLPRPTTLVMLDDDRFVLDHLPRLLARRFDGQDLGVVACAGYEEAARAVAAQPAGRRLVVLADFDLGERRTGLDLLTEVAARRPDAVRLLYSARTRGDVEHAPRGAPVHAFLEKPLRLDDLVSVVAKHLAAEPLARGAGPAASPPASAAPAPEAFAPGPQAGGAASAPASSTAPRAGKGAWGDIPDEAYRLLVTSILDYAIFMLDPQGRVVSWNKGAQRIKGYKADEILGKHFSVFYPPNDVASHRPQFELKVAERDGCYEENGWRIRKDGSMFWANVVITAVRDGKGDLVGFAKVTRDLTDRKHAEEALRQSEERYRLLVESVKDYAIFMLDPQGRVVSWNEGAQRIKGYKASEIIGEHFSTFYTAPDRARGHPAEELRIAMREGAYEEEGPRVRKDGTTFWASVVITALYGANGEHRGFAKVTRDLTTRREAEERIRRQAQEYQDLSREMESFSYTVAHDLRAPLRAVIHLADILVQDEDMPAPERKELLRTLRQSAERMGQLVEDLLNLSRAHKGTFEAAPIDLSALAREVVDNLPSPPRREGVDVRIHPGMRAQGDARLVRIVLENLLGNAFKFTRRTQAPTIEVGATEQDGREVFFVRDNGVGFDPAAASTLFRPFQRLHPANDYEGTGIGLATVQRVVRRHGGEAWATAAPGQGATFFFTLGGAAPPDA